MRSKLVSREVSHTAPSTPHRDGTYCSSTSHLLLLYDYSPVLLRRLCATARRELRWAEAEGWQPGYVGKGDGYGRFVNPDGGVVEGSCVRGQVSSK